LGEIEETEGRDREIASERHVQRHRERERERLRGRGILEIGR